MCIGGFETGIHACCDDRVVRFDEGVRILLKVSAGTLRRLAFLEAYLRLCRRRGARRGRLVNFHNSFLRLIGRLVRKLLVSIVRLLPLGLSAILLSIKLGLLDIGPVQAPSCICCTLTGRCRRPYRLLLLQNRNEESTRVLQVRIDAKTENPCQSRPTQTNWGSRISAHTSE